LSDVSGPVTNPTALVKPTGYFIFSGSSWTTATATLEVARHGITVNAVCPGFTETDMLWTVPENIRQRILERIPMNRFGTAEEIASCVRYIVTEGDYMTAQAISINGGVYI
jgi:acetoacetyl-CoA reductase